MNTREYAMDIINIMDEEQLEAFIHFMTSVVDRSTLARIESRAIAADPAPKCYDSFQEFMKETERSESPCRNLH